MTTASEHSSMRHAHRTVWFCGAVLALAGGAWGGLWWTFSIGLGAALGAINLLVLSHTVTQLVEGRRASWGAVAVVKFAALIGLLYFLIGSGWVTTVGLAVGLGALPVGIFLSGLFFPAGAPHRIRSSVEPSPHR